MTNVNANPDQSPHCAIAARQHEAQLFGTAPRVDVWFLLEYPFAWDSHATDENDLPPAVQSVLKAQLGSIPNTRLQFIKREDRQTLDNLTLYVARASERQPALYEITLESIDNLLDLDFAALLKGNLGGSARVVDQPVFLVCTNNQRDSCCARGLPIYETLRQHDSVEVWQTTHIGGHRYAATLIAFPHSLYYGQVEPDDVAAIVNVQQQGRVYLPRIRGRTCYDPVVQAADYYLRSQTSQTAIDALQLQTVTDMPDGGWAVTFQMTDSGSVHTLHLTQQLAGYQLPKSCYKDPVPVQEFRLVESQIV